MLKTPRKIRLFAFGKNCFGTRGSKVRILSPRLTFVNEMVEKTFVRMVFSENIEFSAELVLGLVEPGLYSKRR